jgi:hypothetical protein
VNFAIEVQKRMDLQKDLRDLQERLLSNAVAYEMLQEVRRAAPRRTGRLAGSFGAKVDPGEEIDIYSTSFIARLYNYGFRPHVWFTQLPGGRKVFHHSPGARKNPQGNYAEPAVKRVLRRLRG